MSSETESGALGRSGGHGARRPTTIAILSYDRPHYLTQVLDSLAPQLNPLDQVYLFQDGAWNPHSGAAKTDHKLIEECCAHFSRMIPQGKIILSKTNLGIAGNYRRADEILFVENEAPYALFLEDDLVLSAHYLQIIDRLLKLAEGRPSIGYVSAYGDLWASLESQKAAPGRLQPMHENWGSALTRQSWLKQRKVRDAYWALVENYDYSRRDHGSISEFYQQLGGYNVRASSQDSARWVACVENNLARVTTKACHARYIGERGEHFGPEHYSRCRFTDSILYPSDHDISAPSEDLLARWIQRERQKLKSSYFHDYMIPILAADAEAIKPPYPGGSVFRR